MSDPVSTPASSQQAPNRRRFLQGGAALSAALVAGAGLPRAGRAQPAPDDPSKVLGGPLRPYGARSRFEESVRERPPGGLETFGGNLLTPRHDARDHHAVGAPLCGAARWHARHRPAQAPAPPPWPGRSSGAPDHGGDPALALHLAYPLSRMPGQLAAGVAPAPYGCRPPTAAEERPGNARPDELQRVDRRAAVAPPA